MRMIDADKARTLMSKLAEKGRPCAETAEAMIKWLDEQPTVGGWTSVKDRLPEYTGWYLTYHHKINLCVVSWFTGDGWEDGDWGAYEDGWVSHWMPLPEDPKEVSGNAAD